MTKKIRFLGWPSPLIEGPRKKTSPSNFGKIEHCQKHSKFHMRVCLCVLYTDLYLISCVFAFLSIIIVCRNENKVLAAFILHSQPVVWVFQHNAWSSFFVGFCKCNGKARRSSNAPLQEIAMPQPCFHFDLPGGGGGGVRKGLDTTLWGWADVWEKEKRWRFACENKMLWVQPSGGWRTSLSLDTRKSIASLEELRVVLRFVCTIALF